MPRLFALPWGCKGPQVFGTVVNFRQAVYDHDQAFELLSTPRGFNLDHIVSDRAMDFSAGLQPVPSLGQTARILGGPGLDESNSLEILPAFARPPPGRMD